jgi:hypothetical protein
MHSSDGKNSMPDMTMHLHGLGTVSLQKQGSVEQMLGMYGVGSC